VTNLDRIIENIHSEQVYIQTHNFPDPDAIACAYGLACLLESGGIGARICYKGNIDKTVTAKMIKLLGIDVIEYSSAKDLDEKDEIILVDAQKGNSNIIDMDGQEIICIDHHPIYEKVEYLFSDIRTEVGACASIIASYYFENDIPMPNKVITALLYGIKMDTANLKRGVSQLDLDMFYKLYMKADRKVLEELDSSVLGYEDIQAYKEAFDTIDKRGEVCFANAGNECQEALIASICDFVLSLDGVSLAVVYSVKNSGIKLSVRSNGDYSAGRLVVEALNGIGTGGGHENMAGGFVPYSDKSQGSGQEIRYLQNEIKDRFLKLME